MGHLPQQRDVRPPAIDRMWAGGLHARYGDLIARYVNRRTDSPHDAAVILDSVFLRAAEHRETVPDNALPWLIATARHECAQVRRSRPPAQAGGRERVLRARTA